MQSTFLITLIPLLVPLVTCTKDGGQSEIYRHQDDKGLYKFGYKIKDPWGSQFHKEHGDPWVKRGSYGLKLADGRERIVKYVADKHGFRAKIITNEPGTTSLDSADAIVNGADDKGHSHSYIPSGHKKDNYHGEHYNGQVLDHPLHPHLPVLVDHPPSPHHDHHELPVKHVENKKQDHKNEQQNYNSIEEAVEQEVMKNVQDITKVLKS